MNALFATARGAANKPMEATLTRVKLPHRKDRSFGRSIGDSVWQKPRRAWPQDTRESRNTTQPATSAPATANTLPAGWSYPQGWTAGEPSATVAPQAIGLRGKASREGAPGVGGLD